MKSKLFAAFTLCVLMFNLAGFIQAQSKRRPMPKPGLVALLPASDGVAVIDVRRFLSDAMPKLLAGNQKMLAEVTTAFEEAKSKTGIDLQQFDSVAAGFTTIKVKEKEYDFDAVIVARGNVSASGVVSAALSAAEGKYRTEKLEQKTIYVFSAKEITDKSLPTKNEGKTAIFHKMFDGLSREMAVTVIDPNTIVFGSLGRVKETVEGRTKVGTDISSLLSLSAASVMAFATKVPEGMSTLLPLDNDELGKNIDSIKYLHGSINTFLDKTIIYAYAVTEQNEQAASLYDTLEGLQILGKAFLGNAKGADKQVYARLIENVKFAKKDNAVAMSLLIAQPDIDFLVGLLAK